MQITSITGIVAGIFTSVSLVPQLVKMVKEKKAAGISVLMIAILLVGLGLWIVYGFLKNDLPIIITNCFSFLVNLCILVMRFWYARKKK
jgi:MtN3 and saliva related transmembrane protein